MEVKVQTK